MHTATARRWFPKGTPVKGLPWQTTQKAAKTLTAGDTVYIRAGTYFEQVAPQNSGSSGQFITYAAFAGETVTIDGTGVDVPDYNGLLFYLIDSVLGE